MTDFDGATAKELLDYFCENKGRSFAEMAGDSLRKIFEKLYGEQDVDEPNK